MSVDDDAVSTIATRVDHHVGYHFFAMSHLRIDRPPQCTMLRVQYTFSSDFVIDPYELDLHESTFSYELHSRPDLELPVFAVSSVPATLKLSVSPQVFNARQDSFDLALPFHARYGRPSPLLDPDEAYEILRFPQPNAFWQCTYPDGTSYNEHFWLNATTPDITVLVPVGVSHDTDFVELGTVTVITFIFVYLLWVFVATSRRISSLDRKTKSE
ncbi:hypothetical protein BDY19DRAFT_995699 [Irpex rosettiformis]|uniref:Uncharacterized protein n=1 Tax=Irpex rosettiformis TaxID=378272 RepID=A0ACB8TXJ3_9APHY|nr:hypothetical protein BDY19DRAFT_995699 [Irpex rosettiformis]